MARNYKNLCISSSADFFKSQSAGEDTLVFTELFWKKSSDGKKFRYLDSHSSLSALGCFTKASVNPGAKRSLVTAVQLLMHIEHETLEHVGSGRSQCKLLLALLWET